MHLERCSVEKKKKVSLPYLKFSEQLPNHTIFFISPSLTGTLLNLKRQEKNASENIVCCK